ncbi:MAG: hypothetical protein LBV46_00610 [Bacteroidales bacterium]|nr:hypothetical protein [Bacteroidales bacterium]
MKVCTTVKHLTIILIITAAFRGLYAQNSDVKISDLFTSQNYFTLQKQYPKLKKHTGDQLCLFTEAYLQSDCSIYGFPDFDTLKGINL